MEATCQVERPIALIRLAAESDVDRIVEMGLRFRRESVYKRHVDENADSMRALAVKLVETSGLLVLDCNGTLVGMLGFMVLPHILSGEMLGLELFWWTEPEHRGEGRRLLKSAEIAARARGAKRMQMVAFDSKTMSFYERMGYEFVESAYQRTL